MGTTEDRAPEVVQPGAVRVRRALLTVSDKRGLVDFARGLAELGVEIVSTGGTARELEGAGLSVRPIDDYTGFPEILDGRVKTLNPRIYAGLLAVRSNPAFAAVVSRPESYDAVLEELRTSGARLSEQTREALAMEAFAYTARYDAAIARWFAEREDDFPALYPRVFEKVLDLSYGENPHQRAAYYATAGARTHLLSMVSKLHGKELSFNNLLDLDSARRLVSEFEIPAAVIVKHNNPCGAAVASSLLEAFDRAF